LKIAWFSPLDRLFGSTSERVLTGPRSVGQLLQELMSEKPAFAPFARFSPGDRQPHGLMVWRRGQVLTLADQLQAEDELEMVILVAGG
jgi:hypothetical protein